MKREGNFWGEESVELESSKKTIRRLTSGEISLARSVFEDMITYHKVWVHNDSYLSVKMQGARTAMTPDGEMYYPDAVYSPDFSSTPTPGASETVAMASHLFIHEMTHVWQYQQGYLVKLHGLFSGMVDYHYDLNLNSLSYYGMEQQAAVVADYWLLKNYGLNADLLNVYYIGDTSEAANVLLGKYKKILGLFPRCII
ncbi:type IV secretion protein Rhs [Citrobacter farmeri]|uniref:type IV secretion protein Rhs n=1 Tax=Citrobacter farmeri TaxID=67824 RepID=UPI001E2C77DD|nr:type IV secretion protein Rhs [Citrobacter farmeri]MDB2181681.1 type IV secretion protein Rhs [Citrobacter farmeri]